MFTIKTVAPVLGVLALAAGGVVVGLFAAGVWGSQAPVAKSIATQTPAPAPNAAIPPLDAAAPEQFETATFALG